ncbi:MAG: phosphoadenosine phosphosulfate reductase family protein, partial [Candidatus Bathyarchaeia archaeon]
AELWDLYVKPSEDFSHMRVHPILHWTELDVWEYVKQEGLPINPLYFAKDGMRYRSLGCKPCTVPTPSKASTIDEIVEELAVTEVPERAGRAQDKERAYMMQKLRSLGYM